MLHWLLFYEGVDDYINARQPHRAAHIEYLKAALDGGGLLHAGALGDPPTGSALSFLADSAEAVEEFARNDPYVVNCCVRAWRFERWIVVIGEGAEQL
jgi:uncharacterized protein YciI